MIVIITHKKVVGLTLDKISIVHNKKKKLNIIKKN